MSIRRTRNRRAGNVLVLTAFMMLGMMALLAFAIDLGYLYVAKTELQRTADAAAMAAAWELLDDNAVFGNETTAQTDEQARTVAAQYASFNRILTREPSLASDDVTVGYLNNPWNPAETINPDGSGYNAVRVRVQRTPGQNGAVPMLFGRLLGVDETPLEAAATAVTMSNFGGFQAEAGDDNIPLLPFTLHIDTWNDLLAGKGDDEWMWDTDSQSVQPGCDGVPEAKLYPESKDSPGNFGTLDIGSSNNSTDDICRQILEGISPSDLAYHGGKLELNEYGKLPLNGDTGVSAAVKEELKHIRGQPRIIPIYEIVENPGDNAIYTIVQFVGVRVLDVRLTGGMSVKRVTIQPCKVIVRGGIPRTETQHRYYVYSPVWLIR